MIGRKYFISHQMKESEGEKAIFIDRDGVINYDPGEYTTSVGEFRILPGVLDTLAEWHRKGYKLIVITNQAGIAKHLYTHDDLAAIHQYFQGQCILHGFAIESFYYCPHHPEFGGKCLCRKPGSLMIEKALHRYQLRPENCVMIGDKQRDLEAASGAGVKGVLVETNSGLRSDLID